MTRIPTPATIADAPERSRPLLDAVAKQLGSAPNLFRLAGVSPAALDGYLHISDGDFAGVKLAGYTDAQVIEIVQHVALNTWTNYFNEVFQTEIDFPVVTARKAA